MPIPIMATLLICLQSAWVILNSSSFISISSLLQRRRPSHLLTAAWILAIAPSP